MSKKINLIYNLGEFRKKISSVMVVEKMIFFGSRARGKSYSKESDIDLILVSTKFRGKRFRERALSLYEYWNLDMPFDFLCYTPEEFKKRSKGPSIVKEAVDHGIEIN